MIHKLIHQSSPSIKSFFYWVWLPCTSKQNNRGFTLDIEAITLIRSNYMSMLLIRSLNETLKFTPEYCNMILKAKIVITVW